MSTVIVFDLDDTLYPEITYVKSGLQAVANDLERAHHLPAFESYHLMLKTLFQEGRGKVFDWLLKYHGIHSKKSIKKCINVYRHHRPVLTVDEYALQFLEHERRPKYLVTDGHKIVQSQKIQALNISCYFQKTYITHRYGIAHAKPSLHCFELIRKKESIPWEKIVYIGDNPAKDFVNLNKVGATTIRVLTGCYKDTQAKPGYDAKWMINNLSELNPLLENHT